MKAHAFVPVAPSNPIRAAEEVVSAVHRTSFGFACPGRVATEVTEN